MNPLSMQFPFAAPSRLNVVGCGLAVAAALPAGCGRKEETTVVTAAEPAAAPASAAAASTPLKVAFAHVGPVGDGGKEVLTAGAVADDKFFGAVNFYVKSVEGQVLGGKGGK